MEEVDLMVNPNQQQSKTWIESDNFAESVDSAEGIVKDATVKVKETTELIIDEAKTIAPEVLKTLKESSDRLNSKQRVFSFAPNNVLVYGTLGILSYILVKKVL